MSSSDDDYVQLFSTDLWTSFAYLVQNSKYEKRIGGYLQYHYNIRSSFNLIEVSAILKFIFSLNGIAKTPIIDVTGNLST